MVSATLRLQVSFPSWTFGPLLHAHLTLICVINPLMKHVFWPVDLVDVDTHPVGNALVLGVRLEHSAIVVINVVTYHEPQQLIDLGVLRQKTRGSLELANTESSVSIVGYFGEIPEELRTDELLEFTIDHGIITTDSRMTVLFDPPPPNSMQFYTLLPISISLTPSKRSSPKTDSFMKLIKEHTPGPPLDPCEELLSLSIDTLNTCWTERQKLVRDIPGIEKHWEAASILSPFRQLVSTIKSSFMQLYLPFVLRPMTSVLLYLIIAARHVCLILISLLNKRLSQDLPSLIEISATAQQIDLRLQQFCYFPIQYLRTTRLASLSHEGAMLLPKDQYPEYIRFYNTLWLIVNDLTIGLMVRAILLEHQTTISSFIDKFVVQRLLSSEMDNISVWLMNSPGGIKLNNELSMFMSDLFRWILEFWRVFMIGPIAPHYGTIINIIGLSSIFGATFSVALFSDFLSVITFHIYCFYIASAKIYHWQLDIMYSLFQLFCGKKRNVLRDRVDSNDYEVDQLLMGTLLFTVNVFLLPTVLAFYVMFSFTELIIIMITGSLEILMTLFNHFPLFVTLLRIKNYKRLPGGIRFSTDKGMVRVHIKALTLSEVFAPFTNVLQSAKSSYLSASTLKGILTGYAVQVERRKLYKLLYSALPSTRMSTADLLEQIKRIL